MRTQAEIRAAIAGLRGVITAGVELPAFVAQDAMLAGIVLEWVLGEPPRPGVKAAKAMDGMLSQLSSLESKGN